MPYIIYVYVSKDLYCISKVEFRIPPSNMIIFLLYEQQNPCHFSQAFYAAEMCLGSHCVRAKTASNICIVILYALYLI